MTSGYGGLDVSVIIVTYNSSRVLPACLEALQSAMGDLIVEVLVADNGSSDDSVAVVERLAPNALIVSTGENVGYAAAINAAMAVRCRSRAVVVMNPDVRLAPGALQCLRDALDEDPRAGVAAPRILDGNGSLVHSLFRDPTILRALGDAVLGGDRAGLFRLFGGRVSRQAAYEQSQEADWASGAVLMISDSCARSVAAWDESFFLYSEETEFQLRAREFGFTVRYVPDAVAVHLGGDSDISPELWTLLVTNRVRLFRRRHGMLAGAGYWAANVLNEALRSVRHSRTHRAALRALFGQRGARPVAQGRSRARSGGRRHRHIRP